MNVKAEVINIIQNGDFEANNGAPITAWKPDGNPDLPTITKVNNNNRVMFSYTRLQYHSLSQVIDLLEKGKYNLKFNIMVDSVSGGYQRYMVVTLQAVGATSAFKTIELVSNEPVDITVSELIDIDVDLRDVEIKFYVQGTSSLNYSYLDNVSLEKIESPIDDKELIQNGDFEENNVTPITAWNPDGNPDLPTITKINNNNLVMFSYIRLQYQSLSQVIDSLEKGKYNLRFNIKVDSVSGGYQRYMVVTLQAVGATSAFKTIELVSNEPVDITVSELIDIDVDLRDVEIKFYVPGTTALNYSYLDKVSLKRIA